MDIETRLHPRILVNWYAFIKTYQGSVTGKTKDISVDGVCIFSPVEPELGESFKIVLKPPGAKSIPVIAKLVWSDNLDIDDKAVFGMGIRFMAIAPEDRKYIGTLVEQESNDEVPSGL
ncbi:MAG: PilZ domain-containing protein [Deltaproteobacteria bacterium]|jgi:hypothetical protein|nr:PilZ domain-containing protein [Deltaproteobacteria bacterium]